MIRGGRFLIEAGFAGISLATERRRWARRTAAPTGITTTVHSHCQLDEANSRTEYAGLISTLTRSVSTVRSMGFSP